MKIAAINGSPKMADSTSACLIGQMEKLIGEQIETYHASRLVKGETPPETLAGILDADILLIVFPLYVDSLPAPLIELLSRLERAGHHDTANPLVFTIANCGFFEKAQNTLALEMIEHFANRAGLPWGYGIGIGGGGMLSAMGKNWEKGIASGIYRAMYDMAVAMRENKSGKNVFNDKIVAYDV